MSTQYSPKVVTDGLILALDAGNPKSYTSGSATWKGLASPGYSASIQGPGTSNNLYGGSCIFSGSTSFAITNYLAPSPSVTPTTYEMVFQPVGAINNYSGLIGYSGYLLNGFSVGMFPNYIVTQGYSGSTGFYLGTYDILTTDRPNHLTVVFGYRSIKIYHNGTLQNSGTYNFDVPASPVTARIGNQTQGGWQNTNAQVFSTKIYSRELSDQEILQNYNATKTRFGL